MSILNESFVYTNGLKVDFNAATFVPNLIVVDTLHLAHQKPNPLLIYHTSNVFNLRVHDMVEPFPKRISLINFVSTCLFQYFFIFFFAGKCHTVGNRLSIRALK